MGCLNFRNFVLGGLVVSMLGLLGACSAKPTVDECRQSLLNAMGLAGMTQVAIDKMSKGSPLMKSGAELCVKNKSRKRVLCEIGAKSIAELKACQ